MVFYFFFFFSSRRRHTRWTGDWSSDVCSSDLAPENWSPSQALGTRNGKNAAKHVQQIGFPEGVNVWLDLEGAKTSTPHETMIDRNLTKSDNFGGSVLWLSPS